jgi:O-methyltransferase involved in polyketide biosynthesis
MPLACSLDPRQAESAAEVRLYHITQLATRTAAVRRMNGRQRTDAQPWCSIRQRQYALIFAEPHGLVFDQQRDHGDIGPASDLERRAAEAMQPARGRARALGKNEHMKALADALAGLGHDVPRIERSRGPLEEACGF